MGIPKFFRWITRRYPLILQQINSDDDIVPIDNLYLDLNGIVHNCVHGNDPKRHERISRLNDMEELWAAIMRAIDEVVHIMKPKQHLFLAVDGVAPRAKMNQQRARRFRSARERALLKQQIEAQGKTLPELFDSNAISPGTQFMSDLCEQLHFFVKYKINTDPLYANLAGVEISDGQVPGEGEHKMLDYIRKLRSQPDYDPNTRHCFYGADADLIMLSLLTHEPHFTIIREEHVTNRRKAGGVQRLSLSYACNFQIIHIALLREYFMLEFKELNGQLKFRFDLERIIDDFVFFCFFIGNDFLPSLSALDIAEGSLDDLIDLYKELMPTMDDYITDSGVIHWDRAENFIQMLGRHENDVFKARIDEINYNAPREMRQQRDATKSGQTPVVNEPEPTPKEAQASTRFQALAASLNTLQEQLLKKKKIQVTLKKIQKQDKKFKMGIITKKFKEDEQGGNKITPAERNALDRKLRAAYTKQTQGSVTQEEIASKTGLKFAEEIKEEYLSDLKPEDIPDDMVSDVEMDGVKNNKMQDQQVQPPIMAAASSFAAKPQEPEKLKTQEEVEKEAEQENKRFLVNFVREYAVNPRGAKATYYQQKVGIDVNTEEGDTEKKRMLKKYLEGLQWVLYYYYRGARHWRWYYPYHYAPMISDIGENIVENYLQSKTVIEEFEIDSNCPEMNAPYTPFQQLLAIMPLSSFKLLPKCYLQIASGPLRHYFPEDFKFDLNGKALAWEAIVLIPFIDESVFIQKEVELFAANKTALSQAEQIRNTTDMTYYSYHFDIKLKENGVKKRLPSTLTGLKALEYDYSVCNEQKDYKSLGEEGFSCKQLAGVKTPSAGYPTFKTLNVIDIHYDQVYVARKIFKRALVVIPQVIEEAQPENLEKYLYKLTKQAKKDVFIGFPNQREAFPMTFEDRFSVYTLYGDYYENQYSIQVNDQALTEEEWIRRVETVRGALEKDGIYCPEEKVNVLVAVSPMDKVLFNNDFEDQYFYKTYEDRALVLPLSLMLRTRNEAHPMNVDLRCSNPDEEVMKNQQVICHNLGMYGLLGQVAGYDKKRNNFKVKFDTAVEGKKVHNPFLGKDALVELQNHEDATNTGAGGKKRWYSEKEIDKMLGLEDGSTSQITSSVALKFKEAKSRDRSLIDIGLNLKSWAKRQHVPGFVRFHNNNERAVGMPPPEISPNMDLPAFNHHSGGRQQWQYSTEAIEFIKEYNEKFPEVLQNLARCRKALKSMPDLKDVIGANDEQAIEKVRKISRWLTGLPMADLPFVDIGFETLDRQTIEHITKKRETISQTFQPIDMPVKQAETIGGKVLFAERFPFWSPLYLDNKVDMFKMGHRVMNLFSMGRNYRPFGARGTVVGKTKEHVIVMFDEQFLQGTNINGHCGDYRGAMVDPAYLLNLTRKFEHQVKKNNNYEMVSAFTEKDPSGKQEQPALSLKKKTSYKKKSNGNASQQQSSSASVNPETATAAASSSSDMQSQMSMQSVPFTPTTPTTTQDEESKQ